MSDRIDVADIIAPVLGVAGPQIPANQTELGPGYRYCAHEAIRVDPEDRTVSCGGCGKALDAFDVLHQYARKERTWRFWEKEIRDKTEALAKLKADERKTKARTKAASRKDAAAAVAAERAQSERERIEISEATRDIVELCRRIERRVQRRRTV